MRLGCVGGCCNRRAVFMLRVNGACRCRLVEFRHYCRVITIFAIYRIAEAAVSGVK